MNKYQINQIVYLFHDRRDEIRKEKIIEIVFKENIVIYKVAGLMDCWLESDLYECFEDAKDALMLRISQVMNNRIDKIAAMNDV